MRRGQVSQCWLFMGHEVRRIISERWPATWPDDLHIHKPCWRACVSLLHNSKKVFIRKCRRITYITGNYININWDPYWNRYLSMSKPAHDYHHVLTDMALSRLQPFHSSAKLRRIVKGSVLRSFQALSLMGVIHNIKMKDKLVNVDPLLGQRLDPIARQRRWRSGPNAHSIMIGQMLPHAQLVGLTPAQHLEMVNWQHTNVGCKQCGLCAIFRWYNNWANNVSCMF